MVDQIEILIVEDNRADADLAVRALETNKLANRIHVLPDGAEALEYLFCTGKYASRKTTDLPRVILLDLKLPKVDGLDVLRAIKSDERTKTVPVVMMTSSQEENDLVSSYQLGVNSYIVKPVDFDQFVEAVKDIGMYWLVTNKPPPPPTVKANA